MQRLLIMLIILISTFLITYLLTRRSEYFRNDMFPYIGKSPSSSINGSVLSSTNTTDRSPAIVLIAILAYMHTGSSYTGSIFQNHPGTFYFYEPIRSLQESSRENASIMYLNGFKRKLSGDWIREDVAIETVQNLLHCKHNQLDFDLLTRGYYSNNYDQGRDQIPYFKCIKKSKIRTIQTIQNCLPLLTNPCLKANFRAFKFIRLPMGPVYELLKQNQNLKCIYLVRDPRAMLDSQVRKHEMGTWTLKGFSENSKRLCGKMHDDFKIYKSFPQNIRDRIMLVRYEDLTDNPPTVASQLLHFTNVPILDEDRRFVTRTTRKKENSTRHKLDIWRTHVSQAHVNILNRHCGQVFEHFGYLKYTNIADIRNFKRPTHSNE